MKRRTGQPPLRPDRADRADRPPGLPPDAPPVGG